LLFYARQSAIRKKMKPLSKLLRTWVQQETLLPGQMLPTGLALWERSIAEALCYLFEGFFFRHPRRN